MRSSASANVLAWGARIVHDALLADGRRLSRVATATMIAATPLIAFWIIGDQSVPGNPDDLDYLFRIRIASTAVLIAGVLSSLAFVAAAKYLAVNRSASGGIG